MTRTAAPRSPRRAGRRPTRRPRALGEREERAAARAPRARRFPWRLQLEAPITFSGVIGVSSTRTPTASYTALATAGMTGSSGPCPASLAPKGPSGSSVSTRMVWISGVSSVVGLLYSSMEGILCTPFRKTCSSMSTSPSPM